MTGRAVSESPPDGKPWSAGQPIGGGPLQRQGTATVRTGATLLEPQPLLAEAIRKAETLLEALQFVRKFRTHVVVVKLGGSVMEHAAALDATLQDVVFMEAVGLHPVVVHGGGKAITAAMAKAGSAPRFVQGRRYTDEATLKIVADTLIDDINFDLVERIEKLGGSALGMHPRSRPCLFGERLTLDDAGTPVDLGHVGRVTRVDGTPLRKLASAGIIPVLPSLAEDAGEGLLNVNADTAAAAVAENLAAEKLVFVSDTPGILRDPADEATLLRSLSESEVAALVRDGVITGGMIPKVEACLASLRAGVKKIHLVDGRVRHALLLEIYTAEGVGTEIVLHR